MMAFFLLMWLLGSTAKGDLQGIADYFQTPLKVALQGGSGSGDSSHIIKGGGKDLTRTEGQQCETASYAVASSDVNMRAADAAHAAQRTASKLQELKAASRKRDRPSDGSCVSSATSLLLDITTEGLRVQIVDEQNRPMFAVGRAELQPYARDLLLEIGRTLNSVENKISLAGHTDATPYASGETRLQQLGAFRGPSQCLPPSSRGRRHGRKRASCG